MAGTTQKELAEKLGITPATQINYEKNERVPPASYLELFSNLTKTNVHWLVTGHGPMRLEGAESKPAPPHEISLPGGYVAIPVYDVEMAAGNGILIEAEPRQGDLLFKASSFISRSIPIAQLAAVYVKGDSMEPTISNGATIVVDRSDTDVGNGGIFALVRGGGSLVKRLQLDPVHQNIRLVSDNPLYPPFQVREDELKIIGRVVWKGEFV